MQKLLIGRQFMIKYQIDLLLRKGLRRITVETENGPKVSSGSIRYQQLKKGVSRLQKWTTDR
jgi:hypothetical protein